MGDITFSVVIPTLNEEKNLEVCFNSMMKQTYDKFEVIIVDGGSKDRTIEMAKLYGFDILEVEKKRPHDVSSAKNEGSKHSRGDVLFFLDADMSVDANCFEIMNEAYQRSDVVGVACKVLPSKGNPLENVMYEFNNLLAKLANRIGFHELSYFSCHSYRKNCFDEVGGFREDLLACEDLDLSLRIRHMGRYIVTPKTTLWTSPRRLRDWSYPGYVYRYLKYLIQYYFMDKISEFYEDLNPL